MYKRQVISRAYGADKAYEWKSSGADGYTIEEADKASHGTDIILKIKENTEDDNYDEYLEGFRLQGIVKKYSDYIRYPIKMDMERSRMKGEPKEGCLLYTSRLGEKMKKPAVF